MTQLICSVKIFLLSVTNINMKEIFQQLLREILIDILFPKYSQAHYLSPPQCCLI